MTIPRASEKLVALIFEGITQSLSDISQETGGGTLAGYAILTDDDLITIFGVATSVERAASVEPALRYSAVEWPYGYKFDPFERARAELNNSYESHEHGSHSEHVSACFNSIVSALKLLRESNVLDVDCLLYAGSTDPSHRMELMEIESVHLLNSANGIRKWEETHGSAFAGKF